MATVGFYLLVLSCMCCFVHNHGAGFDFTCYNPSPVLDTSKGTRIGGYKSGSDEDADVEFSRVVDTGTGTGLPPASYTRDHPQLKEKALLLEMPEEDGIQRIGAFYCNGTKNSVSYNVITMINNKDAVIVFKHVTITASIGEPVTLEVETTLTDIVWNKDGTREGSWDGLKKIDFNSVEVTDAGIYECYQDGNQASGVHAIIRLIVRDCPADRWNSANGCNNVCPVCYNGGICDDKSGVCICAPGFSGKTCNGLHGRNTFGQDGGFRCSGDNPNQFDGCKGKLFCQLDPYGCSCGSGYKGTDCNIQCNSGTFGADCMQTCHCASGTTCDIATGDCRYSCGIGWSGQNCQVCDTSIVNMVITSPSSTELSVTWDSNDDTDNYIVEYQLKNADQCKNEEGLRTNFYSGSEKTVKITNLLPYSTYNVFVTSVNSVCTARTTMQIAITVHSAPTKSPAHLTLDSSTKTSLRFTWNEIPCGFRGGSISYKYTLSPSLSGSTTDTFIALSRLDPCTSYVFTVKASNTAGDGDIASKTSSTQDDKPGAVKLLTVDPVTDRPDSLLVVWVAPTGPCAADQYTVYHQITNKDQCDNTPGTKTEFTDLPDTSITITGLLAYSTYTVFVSSSNDVGFSEESTGATTATTAPAAVPEQLTLASRGENSLSYTWNEIPCGSRGGSITYKYTLDASPPKSGSTQSTSITLSGLAPCTSHVFTVVASNTAGDGGIASKTSSTEDEKLGKVNNLTIDSVTSDTLSVSWSLQDTSICPTDTHVIKYALNNRDQCQAITDPVKVPYEDVHGTNVSIPQLESHSTYEVFVYSSNDKGLGEENSVTDNTNKSAPSGTPQYLEADVDKYSIRYMWNELICGERNGIIQHYAYTLTPSGIEDRTTTTEVILESLDPCTEYTFSLAAVNSIDNGPPLSLTNTTDKSVPNSPTSLEQRTSNREITVTWNPPEKVTCTIIKYHVSRRTVNKPYDDSFVPPTNPEEEHLLEATTMEHSFENLEPTTEYEIMVSASTETGMGESVSANFSTDPLETDDLGDPVPKPSKLKSNATSVTIEIPQLTGLESEYMTGFKIIVDPQNQNTLTVTPNPGTSYEAGTVDKSAVENGPQEFIVGGLEKNVKYYIFVGTCSVIGEESSCVWSEHISHGGSTKPPPEAIYIPILLIAAVTVVVLVGFVYRRRQFSNKSASTADVIGLTVGQSNGSSNAMHSPSEGRSRKHHTAAVNDAIVTGELPGPVKVTNLKEYVRRKKSGEDHSFADDYQRLPKGLLHSYDAAKDEHNQLKNRYTNIATYDNSRVLLSVQGNDPNSDYINASYIDGYKRQGMYIASQGPNKASMNDFWRMVWEHNLNKIVMVTNLVEGVKPKCDKYWPDNAKQYGSIMVTKKKEDVFTDYTIRVFQISDMVEGGRTVYQFHFTTWPDFGVPENLSSILNFIKIIKNWEADNEAPTVVHCSAGVGRTGTFIAIDSMMEQIKQEPEIDVFQFVTDMRQKRMKMIQTADQYQFIHDALLEHIVFGDTSIPVDAFHETYSALKLTDEHTKVSGLNKQFKNLQEVTVLPTKDQCSGGASDENIDKNRFKDRLPSDSARPFLMTQGAEGSTNYINATFLHGYRTKDKFLATQMPTPNTVGDIWRMIYDYKCSTIVMLNQLDPKDQTISKYWPNEGAVWKFGKISVECASEQNVGKEIAERTFNISLGKSQDVRTVLQFKMKSWPNDGKFPEATAVIRLAEKVMDRIKSRPEERVVVHCIDGNGVTGTFVAIVSSLERLLSEKTVDVFQTVKRLRMCNPRAVTTKKEYKFIYNVLQQQIDSSQVYENYTPTTQT